MSAGGAERPFIVNTHTGVVHAPSCGQLSAASTKWQEFLLPWPEFDADRACRHCLGGTMPEAPREQP